MHKLNITDYYKTDNIIVDNNIKKIIEINNNLIDYINIGACKIEVSDIIFSLIFFAEKNLKNKEEILKRNNELIPEIKQHHKNYVDKVLKYKNLFTSGKKDICVEMCKFLITWVNTENQINKCLY